MTKEEGEEEETKSRRGRTSEKEENKTENRQK